MNWFFGVICCISVWLACHIVPPSVIAVFVFWWCTYWMASLGCRQWLFTPVTCRRLLSFFRYDYTSSLFVPFTAWRGCDWSKNGAATVNEKKKNTWREQGAVCRRLSTCRRVFFGSTRFFFFFLLHTLAWHIWYLWNIWDLSSRFK